MMRISSSQGRTLRLVKLDGDLKKVNFHKHYGFVTEEAHTERSRIRKNAGRKEISADFDFSFTAKIQDGKMDIIESKSCEIKEHNNVIYLKTTSQVFHLDFVLPVTDDVNLIPDKTNNKKYYYLAPIFLFLIALAILVPYLKGGSTQEKELQPEIAPVVIRAEPPKTVTPIEKPKKEIPQETKHQALDEKAKAQKVLTQNLGFLKLLGKKDLSKAVTGGLPTDVKDATAGAGAGGGAGSAGQLLSGLGQGLRKTTVGNTGMAGLGGIGTKGAGGGLGAYGETDLSSGAGRAISTVPLS